MEINTVKTVKCRCNIKQVQILLHLFMQLLPIFEVQLV